MTYQHQGGQFIDEVFIPNKADDETKIILEELTIKEIKSQGLDPLNMDDVKEFWRRKGIEV